MKCGVLAIGLYAITYRFNIKIQYWGRYQIVWKKLHQQIQYDINEMSKHKIGKYENSKDRISKYWHLAIFRKSCQYCNIRSRNRIMLEL